MPITGCLSTKQDVPPASPVVEAPTAIFIDVVVTLVYLPQLEVVVGIPSNSCCS